MPLTLSRRPGEAIAVDGSARVSFVRWCGSTVTLTIAAPQATSIKRVDAPPAGAVGRLVLKIRCGQHVDLSGPALIKFERWTGRQMVLSFVAPEATQIVRSAALKRKEVA